MRGDLQWHKTELAAREANGRGDRELAIQLMAQAVTEARDPSLPWHELQSALAGSALFHEHVTFDFALAMAHYRESHEILSSNIGADARESVSFAECMAECAAKLLDDSD
ncbi:hypothetical protein [Stieleria varia]|uniref:Tetratricopeptide repeat protein n=1 Tax=Stieleria varia TaxID=2528005 RepID=A0A5C6B2T7_9BACT|nr:hypothetical protein [Stieleria varia]TWU05792.1 hypothetical protein Pla52n_15070 [Stieleria varia]